MSTKLSNSYISNNKVADSSTNDRMTRLGEKLNRIGGVIENEKVTKFENFDNKIVNLYNSIEDTREVNNRKFNDIKEQILIIQKTIDDESTRRDSSHNEFMDFLKKMEEKIFEKFDFELKSKKDLEIRVSKYLEEKFNNIKFDLQKESKNRFESIDNLENYFDKELPKIQDGFKQEQNERDESDNNNLLRLGEEAQRIHSLITSEKKNREETQEGILEMIKIMNDRMKNDLDVERKEREQNEEVLIDLLEGTCNRLQQTVSKF
jgi:hypothetical protein